MLDKHISTLFHSLNVRRQELVMSYAALAQRSGISMPTVVRALSGTSPNTSFASVVAIAQALGIRVELTLETPAADLRERQAEQKARRLVGMVQGTSALEAQAIDGDELRAMTRQTAHELLAGSARRLWSE
jgi:transcriptional regulator with XRE-family HTH domain